MKGAVGAGARRWELVYGRMPVSLRLGRASRALPYSGLTVTDASSPVGHGYGLEGQEVGFKPVLPGTNQMAGLGLQEVPLTPLPSLVWPSLSLPAP